MKRNIFLIVSALLAFIFGIMMIVLPDKALEMAGGNLGMQSFGVALFSIGIINLFSRNDPGSKALKAVMFGNIVLHLAGIGFDVYNYTAGLTQLTAILGSTIIHILLGIGFMYFLVNIPKHPESEKAE